MELFKLLNKINEEDERKDISLCDKALKICMKLHSEVNDECLKDVQKLMTIIRELKKSEEAEQEDYEDVNHMDNMGAGASSMPPTSTSGSSLSPSMTSGM